MINGTRCVSCGEFVYAREISGRVKPGQVVCEDCREFDCVETKPSMR